MILLFLYAVPTLPKNDDYVCDHIYLCSYFGLFYFYDFSFLSGANSFPQVKPEQVVKFNHYPKMLLPISVFLLINLYYLYRVSSNLPNPLYPSIHLLIVVLLAALLVLPVM